MAARKKSTSEGVPRSGTDHACTKRGCPDAARLTARDSDGNLRWYCHERVPHDTSACTHGGPNTRNNGERCAWCGTMVPA